MYIIGKEYTVREEDKVKSTFKVQFKSVEVKQERLTIKGLISTPDIDRYDDIVNQKGLHEAMESYFKNPLVLYQHVQEKIIGLGRSYEKTNGGIDMTADILYNTDGVFEHIINKTATAFSIGFYAKKWIMREVDGRTIREILELDLVEVSVVHVPANSGAIFTLQKSIKNYFDNQIDMEIKNDANPLENEVGNTEELTTEEVVVEEVADVTVETTEEPTENTDEKRLSELEEEVKSLKDSVASINELKDSHEKEVKSLKESFDTERKSFIDRIDTIERVVNTIEKHKTTAQSNQVIEQKLFNNLYN